jgi:hypothetical protein
MKDSAAVVEELGRIGKDEKLPDESVLGHDGCEVPVRGRTAEIVVVLVRHSACPACDAYERALWGAREALGRWGGRVIAVDGDAPRLLLADRDAVVHEITEDDEHAFPEIDAVELSLEFLASRCPECGAPEGPWLDLAGQSGY